MSTIAARYLGGDRFAVTARAHTITVDQPSEDGGTDTAPTPTELFVAGLTSCVAFYARRYLSRHDLPADGLTVTSAYSMSPKPARVARISVEIGLPDGVPVERRDALLAVASHCTVHNSLLDPPAVTVALADGNVGANPEE